MSLNLSPEEVYLIREAVKNGVKSKNQIAKELGVGERSIRNLLTGRHYADVEGAFPTQPNMGVALTDDQVQAIVDCYNEHKSMYRVSRELKVHRTTVNKYLKQAGIDTTNKRKSTVPKKKIEETVPQKSYEPAPVSDKKLQQIHKLHRAGWTDREIAQVLNLKQKDIKHYL